MVEPKALYLASCAPMCLLFLASCSGGSALVEPEAVAELGPTSCIVPTIIETGDTVDMTVSEFLVSLNDEFVSFNSDENSCDIFTTTGNPAVSLFNNSDGAGLNIFFGTTALLIDSEQQYNDCANDIEAVAAIATGETVVSCPALVMLNP